MKFKVILILFLLLINTYIGFSQTLTSNPYSYYGLGLIENNGFSENSAVGSSGIAMPSSKNLNLTNPASLVGLDSLSFIFDLGIYGKFSNYESKGIKQNDFESNIKYLAVGFRISKRWGSSFGIVPFSSRGYYISATYPAEGNLNEYRMISNGSGNLSRFYSSNSFGIIKNLSLGINASYLFGSLKNDEQLSYNDVNFNDATVSTTNYFKNLYFDFGLQYKFKIGKNEFYTGLTFSPLQNLNTSYKKLVENGSDTLSYESKGTEDFTIPTSIGIGLGASVFNKQLKLMLDYKYMQWSLCNYHYNAARLNDSWQINSGLEFSRDNINSRHYWDYVNYRLGFRYEKSYLSIKNHNINEVAFTAGLGIPTKYDRTIINLSYEYAIKGTSADGLIKEKYNRIILGITLSDRWFQRNKYN